MRALRRPQKAKTESRSSSASSAKTVSIPKSKKLQKSLNSLSTFLNRFDQIDHTIFETVTNLNTFICDILSSTQKHPSHVDYTEFLNSWAKIKIQLSNNIITLNNTQISTVIDDELNKFMNIINQVGQSPPSNQKQQRDSKNVVRIIASIINSARGSANKKQFDKLKIQIQSFRSDLSHQYEPFFKNSQINKEWKETVLDDSRRSLDKVITFCDIGKELGITQFPFVDEITTLLTELSNESEIIKDNAKSHIPRHSPMKFELRKAAELGQEDDKSLLKTGTANIKRVPYSSRSRSEQSSSKVSRIPKPKEQTTPDRPMASKKVRSSLANTVSTNKTKNFFEQESDTENSQSDVKVKPAKSARTPRNSNVTVKNERQNHTFTKPKPAISRSQKPVRASSITNAPKTKSNNETKAKSNVENDENKEKASKKREIVPLQESPKIQRRSNPQNNFASSQQISFKKLKLNSEDDESSNSGQNDKKYLISDINKNNKIVVNIDDSAEGLMNDLLHFEKRFVKYVATVGASDLLGNFVNELRKTQNIIENNQNGLPQHITQLQNMMDQIEGQMNVSKPLFEIEQNLQQALDQMSSLSNAMASSVASNAELAEANSISKQFENVKEQLEKVASERQEDAEDALANRIETELGKFKKAETTFKNAQENNETLKRLRKENIEMRKELQNQKKSKKENENQKKNDSIKLERYKKIVIEMKAVNQRMSDIQIERKENPDDIEEIDAELEALLEQQNGLIEQLNAFEF